VDGRGFRLRHVMAVTMLDQPKYDARRSRPSCTATLRPISTPVGGGNAMMSHHVVYQLVLFALVSLSIMLHLTQPKRAVAAPATPTEEPKSLKPKRHRSSEPKPFEGPTQKPHCALCERETASLQAPPPLPPDPMPSTNRRPRTVDTAMHFCPHAGCDYRGWLGLVNLRARGHPSGPPWRQFHCTSCKGYFLEMHGTGSSQGAQSAVDNFDSLLDPI
jgi:hypothetical protein